MTSTRLAAACLGATLITAAALPAAAQSPQAIREIGSGDNPARVVFECTVPNGLPVQMDMVLRRVAGQVWTYSDLNNGIDCSSLSTGGITCMSDSGRGRGTTLQGTVNDLLADQGIRCTRAF
jgi:hypothetical protein